MKSEHANDSFVVNLRTRRLIGQSPHMPDRRRLVRRGLILLLQLAIVIGFLAGWEWLPTVSWFSHHSSLFDRFFVSSPGAVLSTLKSLLFSSTSDTPIWTYTRNTVIGAMLGLIIGLVVGGIAGLVLGSVKFLSDALRPFVLLANALPRIALVPIVVIIFGPTLTSSVVVSLLVTVFVAFFSAYEGARTVSPQLVENARLLGGSPTKIMLHVRLPFVVAWTLSSLPLAAAFSIISVVTGELLIGSSGLGRLLGVASYNVQSSLTLALVVILGVLGLIMVVLSELTTRRLLHWWGKD